MKLSDCLHFAVLCSFLIAGFDFFFSLPRALASALIYIQAASRVEDIFSYS